MKCRYCDNEADKILIWLKDKNRKPARIKVKWCGCDLQIALTRFWACPYKVVENTDYEYEHIYNYSI